MNNDNPHVQQFLHLAAQAINDNLLVKIVLSKYRGEEADLQRLTIRPLTLRQQPVLSLVYRYSSRDITKNLSIAEALQLLETLLANDFRNAHLFTRHEEIQLETAKKGKTALRTHALTQQQATAGEHNRPKKRFVDSTRPFLTALGITDRQQQLVPSMSHKWKQINKFVEIFSQALGSSPLPSGQPVQVVDFGCGKGYLTFAIHDYLHHTLHNNARVTGVELRRELVDFCNNTAATLEYKGLDFVCGDVKTHAPEHTDVMIALHACDTATDYAIHYGIRANAAIIMCSPCCHKQIRPQMHSPAVLKPLLQYGVHQGQEAEMLTDSLRALLLEAHGYTTKVFEFISLEHTNKNKMILAIKQPHAVDKQQILEQISALKAFYGIREHCLETLLQPLSASAG